MATKHPKKPVRRAKAPVTKRPTVTPLSLDDVRAVVREEVERCFKLHPVRSEWLPISAAPRNKWLLVSAGTARNPSSFVLEIAKVTDESLNSTPPYAICWGGGFYMGVKCYMELPEPPEAGAAARAQTVAAS